MATAAEIKRFVESTRPRDWYGLCAGLTYRTIAECGGYVDRVYGSAWLAYEAAEYAGPIYPHAATCPPGGIHYWDYTDAKGNRYGHVTIDIKGGGTDTLSATHFAHEWWGVSAGLISVAAQSARPGMTYKGWSHTYGARNRIIIIDPDWSGGGEDDMPLTEADLEAIAQRVWRGTTVRRTVDGVVKNIPVIQELADAKTAAEVSASDSKAGLVILNQQVGDWTSNPNIGSGRLYKMLQAADFTTAEKVEFAALVADAVVAKIPGDGGGGDVPADLPQIIQSALVEVLESTVSTATFKVGG